MDQVTYMESIGVAERIDFAIAAYSCGAISYDSMFARVLDALRSARDDDFSSLSIEDIKNSITVPEPIDGLPYDSAPSTKLHRAMVKAIMRIPIRELIERAKNHDLSKLRSPEKELFDKYTPLLGKYKYGSPEYDENRKMCSEHHVTNERHHPEYHKNGINDMDLVDLLEMICDWKASTLRTKDGDIKSSLELNKKRFKIGDQLLRILSNTVDNYLQSNEFPVDMYKDDRQAAFTSNEERLMSRIVELESSLRKYQELDPDREKCYEDKYYDLLGEYNKLYELWNSEMLKADCLESDLKLLKAPSDCSDCVRPTNQLGKAYSIDVTNMSSEDAVEYMRRTSGRCRGKISITDKE